MSISEDIAYQQQRLGSYRRNLQHLLAQADAWGGEVYAPIDIMNSIQLQRNYIAQIKNHLRQYRVAVVDYPEDSTQKILDNNVSNRDQEYIPDSKKSTSSNNEETVIEERRIKPIFDQRGQIVSYQYNAAGDINFSNVQTLIELTNQLEKLKNEIHKASDMKIINIEIATDIEYQITKAVQQVKQPFPQKEIVLDHLNNAKSMIENVKAVKEIVAALVKAGELVQKVLQ